MSTVTSPSMVSTVCTRRLLCIWTSEDLESRLESGGRGGQGERVMEGEVERLRGELGKRG